MLVIGLCGGIGSGKTVASDHFATLGVDIIDTDIIAREIVMPGEPALNALANAFGEEILMPDGSLDRSALRQLAFSSPENKQTLDSITHPAIRTATISRISKSRKPYCVVVIPLLSAESPFIQLLDRIIVVTANDETKISRVQKRNGLSRDEVLRIMRSQITDNERLKFADDIIENNTSLEHVYAEVEALDQVYLKLSQK